MMTMIQCSVVLKLALQQNSSISKTMNSYMPRDPKIRLFYVMTFFRTDCRVAGLYFKKCKTQLSWFITPLC